MTIRAQNDSFAWITAMKQAVLRVIRKIIKLEKYYIVTQDISICYPEKPDDLPVTFRQATVEDIDTLTEEQDYPEEKKKKAKQAIRNGDICHLGFLEGKIVYYHWHSVSRFFIPGLLDLPLGPGKIYGYKTFVAPELRGKGLVRQFYRVRTNDMLSLFPDRKDGIGYIQAKNRSSIRALIEKGDFKIIGVGLALKILGWQKFLLSRKVRTIIQT